MKEGADRIREAGLTVREMPDGGVLLFTVREDGEGICVLPLRGDAGLLDRIASDPEKWRQKVLSHDRALEARFVRERRDALLRQSDGLLSLDRLFPSSPPSPSDIAALLNSPAARYRQALRDLPSQPGFPYHVSFPEL